MTLTHRKLREVDNDVRARLRYIGLSSVVKRTTVVFMTEPRFHRAECVCDPDPVIAVSRYFPIQQAILSLVPGVSAGKTLTEILLHEYGHASVAVMGWSRRQAREFGKPPYVSAYACTDWEEDLCESMMCYLSGIAVPERKADNLKALFGEPRHRRVVRTRIPRGRKL